MSKFVEFPSIVSYRQISKKLLAQNVDHLDYTGTIKLHGTNAAIVKHPDSSITVQTRNRIISSTDDNMGFCSDFLYENLPDLNELITVVENAFANDVANSKHNTVAVFGEFCGGSIQQRVALKDLPRMFVVFAVQINGIWMDMKKFNHPLFPDRNIYNIQSFKTYHATINCRDPSLSIGDLSKVTDEVDLVCPFALQLQVSGCGEGIVWSCDSNPTLDLYFKTKGKSHCSTESGYDLKKAAGLHELVTSVITPSRLQQAICETFTNQSKEKNKCKAVINWLYADVIKEESDVIVASGLKQQDVKNAITSQGQKDYSNFQSQLAQKLFAYIEQKQFQDKKIELILDICKNKIESNSTEYKFLDENKLKEFIHKKCAQTKK